MNLRRYEVKNCAKTGVLSDLWSRHGSCIQELENDLIEKDKQTLEIKVPVGRIVLHSIFKVVEENGIKYIYSTPSKLDNNYVIQLDPTNNLEPDEKAYFASEMARRGYEKRELSSVVGDNEELADELIDRRYFVELNNNYYLPGAELITAIGRKADISGKILNTPNPRLFDVIINGLFLCGDEYIAIVRQDETGISKCFSLWSKRYKLVPQWITVKRIIKEIGMKMSDAPAMKRYTVSNYMTAIEVEFDKLANDLQDTYNCPDSFIPGIRILTSDAGESALSVIPYLRNKDAYVLTEAVKMKHTRRYDLERYISSVNRTAFKKFYTIPEKMSELLLVNIPNENKMDLAYGLFYHFKSMGCPMTKEKIEVFADIYCGILPAGKITAYDAYNVLLSFPELAGSDIKKTQKEAMVKLMEKLLYFDYKEYSENI